MKKLLLSLLLVSGMTVFAKEVKPQPEQQAKKNYVVNVSVGIAPWSDYSVKGTTVDGDGTATEFNVTAMKEVKQNWYAGLGFGVHKLADGETKLGGHTLGSYEDYYSYPLYLTTKYEFPVVGNGIKPYVKADLGYAFNGRVKYDVMGEHGKEGVDNGLYAAAGFGIEQNNINVGMMFKTTQGKIDRDDCDNYRVMLTVGYDFDFSI